MMEPDSTPNPEAPAPAPKRRRRRFRAALSLRAMMLLVLVVGGWTGWQVHRARAVRRAIRVIEAAGGSVDFEGSRDAAGHRITRPRVAAWLCDTLGEEYVFDVSSVHINHLEPNSDARRVIEAIASIPRVKRLSFLYFVLGDEDMAEIAGMADLEEIRIWGQLPSMIRPGSRAAVRPLSPSGLARLSRLRKLRSIRLELESGQIDAHALDAMSTLPHLRVLEIRGGDPLDDAEVQALGGFKHLEELDIRWFRPFEPGRTVRPLPIASWAGLRSLTLWFIWLSPDEVRAVSRLGKLERLNCSEFRDGDLPLLRGMKGLKKLILNRWNRIKPESLAPLKAALPGLTIVY